MTLVLSEATRPDSVLARWDVRWKLAAGFLIMAAVTSLRRIEPSAVAFGLAVVVVGLTRTSVASVVPRLAFLILGCLPFVVFLPFNTDAFEEPVLRILLRTLTLGLFGLGILGSSSVPRIAAGLRQLWVPRVLVVVAQLAYRYAFDLHAEARRVRIALRVRGFKPRTDTHTYRTLGHTVGAILVRGGDRGERVAAAMRCRGYQGDVAVLEPFHTTWMDIALFAGLSVAAVVLIVWDRS